MTTLRSESGCVRGCTRDGVHFADCEHQAEGDTCKGCAPVLLVEGLAVCDDCRRRIRGLLRHTPDLLGRMRSLASQGKAVVYAPVKVFSAAGPGSAPDQVDSDLADAILEISSNLRGWSRHFDLVKMEGLDRVLSDASQADRLAAAVIDRHTPDADGGRHWSVADAMVKWGPERRDRHVFTPAEDDDVELLVMPIHESSFDPILVSREAAAHAKVSESQLRKWVAAGELAHTAKLRDGRGVTTRWYRRSEIEATAQRMRDRRHAGVANALE